LESVQTTNSLIRKFFIYTYTGSKGKSNTEEYEFHTKTFSKPLTLTADKTQNSHINNLLQSYDFTFHDTRIFLTSQGIPSEAS
jgi:hypothetical protein